MSNKQKHKKKYKINKVRMSIFILVLVAIIVGLGFTIVRSQLKLELVGDENVKFEMGSKVYQDAGAHATLFGKDLSDKIEVSGKVISDVADTYKIEYKVSGYNKKAVRTVEVTPNCDPDKTKGTYIKGLLLVNKDHPISKDFNPGVNPVAGKALEKLQAAASRDGLNIPLVSGFRSYDTQKRIHDGWVNLLGEDEGNRVSAIPGQSEHQTGLAFDIGVVGDSFAGTKEAQWIEDNAYKFGFTVRYKKGKEDITGYIYEPWHVRYVGKTIASELQESGQVLEEYLGVAK